MALKRSHMVLCSRDWGAHGGNEYWCTLLGKLTLTSIQLLDDAIYMPLGRKTPIGKPGWGSMLSVVDGSLDSAMVQEIQRESNGFTLDVLKKRLRPRDAVETIPGGDEYVASDTVAPYSPCHVFNPDVASECGLSELPRSIHSDDETEHDAFFVQTCAGEAPRAHLVPSFILPELDIHLKIFKVKNSKLNLIHHAFIFSVILVPNLWFGACCRCRARVCCCFCLSPHLFARKAFSQKICGTKNNFVVR